MRGLSLTSVSTTIIKAEINGTTYRIFATPDPWGGWSWLWSSGTQVVAAGWATAHAGGEVTYSKGRISVRDGEDIAQLLDQVRQ